MPQRLLTDNGAALNPSRRGYPGQLVAHVTALADTLAELQAQVDAFDHVYNTERPHQGLPGRVTPLTAWQATEKAEAPRPKPDPPYLTRPAAPRRPPAPPTTVPDGTIVRRLTSQGTFRLDKVTYLVGGQHGFHHVLIDTDGDRDTITVINREGEILAEHTRPAPGVTYVGNGRPQDHAPKPAKRHRSPDTPTVTDVLIQHCHPCLETSHSDTSRLVTVKHSSKGMGRRG